MSARLMGSPAVLGCHAVNRGEFVGHHTFDTARTKRTAVDAVVQVLLGVVKVGLGKGRGDCCCGEGPKMFNFGNQCRLFLEVT